MNFHVMTLFPEMIDQAMNNSILGKAMEKGLISLESINIRDYTKDKHNKVDDYTYGGGAGMLMQAQPVYDCYQAIAEKISEKHEGCFGDDNKITERTDEVNQDQELRNYQEDNSKMSKKTRVIYVTPQGSVFNQAKALELSKEKDLIFLCGHYEGIDERVLEEIVTDYISIGDYVLTGGELAAMVMMDAISRLVPGVLGKEESFQTESFSDGLLEYPQYSRPEEWNGKKVPEVLLSGHHKNIEKWRFEQSLERTRERRPDLYEKYREENPEKFIVKEKRRKKTKKTTLEV